MEPVDSTERDKLPARAATEAHPAPAQAADASPSPRTGAQKIVAGIYWAIRCALALFLFIGALQVMKEGAAALDILKPGGYLVRNAGSTLGLGWLGALLVLSGSPIAATALTLVAGGEEAVASGAAQHFTEIQGYTMLTGSRLGAAFVVLVTAVIYALRGGKGERLKPVSTAVMALCTTALIYVPAAIIGFALLKWEPFSNLEITFPNQFSDIIDVVYGPILDRIGDWNGALLFLGGLGILLLSFKVIDSVMPQLDDRDVESRGLSWLTKKWPMFGLGCLVALITMSVSVALTVLVPLVSKRYVKREHIIPYIMGANITTLGDTMLAGLALNSPGAVRIVLAGIISTTILSLILLTFFYPQIRSGIWKFQRKMTKSKPRLAAFTAALFILPIATIGIAGFAG